MTPDQVRVTVWPRPFVKGFEGDLSAGADVFPVRSLAEALSALYRTDAHFVPYAPADLSDDVCPRVNLMGLPVIRKEGADIVFGCRVVDVDMPKNWKDNPSAFPAEIAAWRLAERQKVDALPWAPIWYGSRGGYRLIWVLPAPVSPETYHAEGPAFREELRRRGLGSQGGAVDELSDWGRCYRLPFVVRDGVDERHSADFENGDVLTWKPRISLVQNAENPKDPARPFAGVAAAKTGLRLGKAIPKHERNVTMTRLAGAMRRVGMGAEAILAGLKAERERLCPNVEGDPDPLTDAELEHIARSVSRYEPDARETGKKPAKGDGEKAEDDEDREGEVAALGARFFLGSEVEIADAALSDLEAGGERFVFDRAALWRYEDGTGLWAPLANATGYETIAGYDGERIIVGMKADGTAKTQILKVSHRLMKDTWALAKVRRTSDGFFDAAPAGLTFRNGFLQVLEGGGLHVGPLAPFCRATVGLPFDYVPGARPSAFLGMLAGCFRDDADAADKIALIQEWTGLCLLGLAPRFRRGLIFTGEGSNGKSSVMDVISALFPRHAVTAVAPQVMDNEYRRARLASSWINVVNELPEAEILTSEAVKAILTGELTEARVIREMPFEFRCRAGHLYAANNLPRVRDLTDGFWKRWIVVPFQRQFATHEQDRGLPSRIIRDELAAVASWALDGACRALRAGDFTLPRSSEEALKDWRADADPVSTFVAEKLIATPDDFGIGVSAAYEVFRNWAVQNGQGLRLSLKAFSQRVVRAGIAKEKTEKGAVFAAKLAAGPRLAVVR